MQIPVFDGLIGPIIVAVLIIKALLMILSATKSMAGNFGEIGSDIAGKIGLGGVTSLTPGGVAGLYAQKTVGRAFTAMAGSDAFKKAASKPGYLGAASRVAYSATDKIAGSKMGAKETFAESVKRKKEEQLGFAKKIATGKDGKPLTTLDQWGNEITTTESYARSLEEKALPLKIAGVITGGNKATFEAINALRKSEKARIELEEKKGKTIEKMQKKVDSMKKEYEEQRKQFREELGASKDEPWTDEQIESLRISELETLREKQDKLKATFGTIAKDATKERIEAMKEQRKVSDRIKKLEGTPDALERLKKEIEGAQEKFEAKSEELK